MKLSPVTHNKIKAHLQNNGTSEAKITRFDVYVEDNLPDFYMAHNDKTTIVMVTTGKGTFVGAAKRCTYAKCCDEFNLSRGIAIATFRAMG